MNILIVCTGNSRRSEMAEGRARSFAVTGSDIEPDKEPAIASAGLEAHDLNPRAVAAMSRQGSDISARRSELPGQAMLDWVDLVVCHHADSNCPLPPGTVKRHPPFKDPAQVSDSKEKIEHCFDAVCSEIRDAIRKLFNDLDIRKPVNE